MDSRHEPLDQLVASLLERVPCEFAVAADEGERLLAYRLRARAVREHGWSGAVAYDDDVERDAYDHRSLLVLGWCDGQAVATGRLVMPPGLLPTEEACGFRVAPVGAVVDVGRLVVASHHQDHTHRILVGLLARMYLEVRARGFTVACGLMAAPVRALVRYLGVTLEVLGEDRLWWGERRAPVRFDLSANRASMTARWGDDG